MYSVRGKRKHNNHQDHILDRTEALTKRSKPIGLDRASFSRQQIDAASLAWATVGGESGDLQIVRGVDVINHGGEVCFLVGKDAAGFELPGAIAGECFDEEPFIGFSDELSENTVRPSLKSSIHDPAMPHIQICPAKVQDNKDTENKQGREEPRRLADEARPNLVASTFNASSSSRAAKPVQVFDQSVSMIEWTALNLSLNMLAAISNLGHMHPTKIQKEAIPQILTGYDVIGKSQTGSGKTLAFAIPVIEKWLISSEKRKHVNEHQSMHAKWMGPWATILCPTRELAKQLDRHFKALCVNLDPTPQVCVITGGLSIQKQLRQLRQADIVIGTPGRFWQILDGDRSLQDSFKRSRFLVLDEADRLLNVRNFQEVDYILGALDSGWSEACNAVQNGTPEAVQTAHCKYSPSPRQTLVFSATFDRGLQQRLIGTRKAWGIGCSDNYMAYIKRCLNFRNKLKIVDINATSYATERLREGLIECGSMEKDLFLYTILLDPGRRSLVFANSISAVRRLVPLMKTLGLVVIPLHSQMVQKARIRSLEHFAMSSSSVLIATDLAARGLDIHDVDQVIHYHVPRSAEVYIHRAGRTARGNRNGLSIILCSPDEVMPMRRLASRLHPASSRPQGGKPGPYHHAIHTLPLDRNIVSRLERRVDLAKRIADACLSKEKDQKQGHWLRKVANDLGVEHEPGDARSGLISDEDPRWQATKTRRYTHKELVAFMTELREELDRKMNLGIDIRYIASCEVDVGALLNKHGITTSPL